jgi:hypothetical protein
MRSNCPFSKGAVGLAPTGFLPLPSRRHCELDPQSGSASLPFAPLKKGQSDGNRGGFAVAVVVVVVVIARALPNGTVARGDLETDMPWSL